MAGESADEVARRAREKAERLLHHAEMFEKGAAGERAVQHALTELPCEWTVFNDLRWPGRVRANIDHVVIGPGGVFVVDAKNWTGTLSVTGGVLRQNGYRRTTAVEGVRAAVADVAALVPPLPPQFFVPVLCFAGDAKLDASVEGVAVCSVGRLVEYLLSRPAVLSQEWLDFLCFELGFSTRAAADRSTPTSSPRARPVRTLAHPEVHGIQPSPPARMPRRRRDALSRLRLLLKRIVAGWVMWWLACVFTYFVIGPVVGRSDDFLGASFTALAVLSAVAVMRLVR